MLDPLPDPVVMMKAIPSLTNEIPSKMLSFKKAGAESDTQKATADGGGDGKLEGSGGKTDEELARILHEKLNP